MKRRTFISLMSVMAAAGVLTLSGCSNSSGSTAASGTAASVAPAAGDQLSNIQSSGKLIVALEGAWQPWSYHDESDTLVGYDVEVSRAIAEKLGVEPEYVESDWDSLFAGLDAGRYDIVCNGVEVTDERAKTYDFTEPYGYIHTALAVRKDNDEITSFEDLKGKTTANSLASTYMELAESYGATVQGIDTLEETIQLPERPPGCRFQAGGPDRGRIPRCHSSAQGRCQRHPAGCHQHRHRRAACRRHPEGAERKVFRSGYFCGELKLFSNRKRPSVL